MATLLISFANAQSLDFTRRVDPFPMRQLDGSDFHLPLTGGLNSPVPQLVDINGDDRPDLFLQDRANQLIYYENIGTPGDYQFQWITDNFEDLQVGDWFKFADIDLDNDFDLLAENPFGIIRYYENIGDAINFAFVEVTDTLRDEDEAPILVDAFSIPEWTDIDQDNQQELFLGRQTGRITYYDLIGFNGNLPIYRKIDDFFGGIEILTGGGATLPKSSDNRHGANSLTFVDIDDDGDNDLFWGDFFAESVILLPNIGTAQTPQFDMAQIQESFPAAEPLITGGFNVPRFGDMDNDGDLDMLIGVLGGSGSLIADRAENLYYYENTGTAQQHNFVLRSKDFVEGIDIGQNTTVVTWDIDGDGDLDLVLSNQEDLASPDRANSRIYLFENQGSTTSPDFQLVDDNWLDYDKRFDLNYAPAFNDLDGDGNADLLIGKWDGKMTYYRNTASSGVTLERIDEFFGQFDIGNNSTPTFVDIDDDGDQDLFIGEFSGNINYYRNEGPPQNPVFTLDTTHFAGIDIGFYCYPHFYDVDDDNDFDLLVGSEEDGIYYYRNEGTATTANYVLQGQFLEDAPLRATPHLVDINGDGALDLLSGSTAGGLLYYEGIPAVGIGNDKEPEGLAGQIELLGNYPNPFNPQTTIKFRLAEAAVVTLQIYDIIGQHVQTPYRATQYHPGTYQYTWNATDASGNPVASGVYYYRLSLPDGAQKVGKMVLIR